ncbi:MAG TPA: glycosyltransferase family 4 protein [Pyrinomonadaceae bacterium]|nr:glycosyltransferase family 4 protein [Pyrinomonadaceae bacterium]
MRILIATVQVPFISGGAEAHAEGLRAALVAAGHEAEIVSVPFNWHPPERVTDHMLACRLLDLTSFNGVPVDLLVGLKFPAYLIPHPNKVLWILHQHRQAYELWEHPTLGDLAYHPNGARVRDAVREADRRLIPEARRVYANSRNVARRLKSFCGVESAPLYHPPPHADEFYAAGAEDYFFFPSRLGRAKRQELVVRALARTRQPVRVVFSGAAEYPSEPRRLKDLADELKVGGRAQWLGPVGERKKRELFARSLAVVYTPFDEDYGYVTLEAMLSSKAVVTCADSGGPLEFVRDGETGLVAAPDAEALASAFDELWQERKRAREYGEAGRALYESLDISWPKVVETLLSGSESSS